jgi:hypothetical protein
MAYQTRQGLASATISRLVSLKFLARQAALNELADIRIHLPKAPRPGSRDIRGPSGVAAMAYLLACAEAYGISLAAKARNRAVALLRVTNALRQGQLGHLAGHDRLEPRATTVDRHAEPCGARPPRNRGGAHLPPRSFRRLTVALSNPVH